MDQKFQPRIVALHDWYCRNVIQMKRTPEVERLWLEWLRDGGYNGTDLRDVIRYIRKQIALGKRNEGALKLTNLFQRSEHGFVGFDMDLGLARARANLNIEKRLEPAPDAVGRMASGAATSVEPSKGTPHPGPLPRAEREKTAADLQATVANLAKLKRAVEE